MGKPIIINMAKFNYSKLFAFLFAFAAAFSVWVLLVFSQSSTITVTSPNGGETWEIGSTVTISWTSTNVSYIYIDLTNKDGGYGFGDSITNLVNVEGNPGTTTWTVVSYANTGTYKLKIGTCSTKTNRNDCGGASVADVYDYSDGIITLVAPATTTTIITTTITTTTLPTTALSQCSEGPIPSSGCKCQGIDKYSGYCCNSLLVNSLVWTNVPCTQTCKSMGGVCCYGAVSDCVGTWSGQWATECQGYVCCIGTCKGTVLPATSCQPGCPSSPTEWSTCINNTQTRTNYKCDASTYYLCDGYFETQPCTSIPTPPPTTTGYCGDNVCSGNETSATCPNDCVSPVTTTPPSSPNVTIPPQPIIQPNLTTPKEKTITLPVPTPLPSPVQSPQSSAEPTKPLPAVDRLRLVQSILTIESLKIKFETLKSKSQSLLNYYADKNSRQDVAKWSNVVDLFNQAINTLDNIKSFISTVRDTSTEGDLDEIANRIDNVLLIIDKVIDVMISG
ncbi:MAG: hypothetical protein HY361_04620 [Candidatus Aenigmarchaeota archaeon]|nr:hypothetical protein [Candidatus Aenigmarchaeota archaeon]